MSKPVKEMIMDDYKARFDGLDGGVVVDIRGIDAMKNDAMRAGLREKSIRVTVIKNTLARKIFEGTALDGLDPALEGPSALAYGADSVVDVARAVVAWAKKIKNLDIKGAILAGTYFDGVAGVNRLSDYPTKPEALAKVVQIVLTPGGKVVGAAKAPGSNILGIVKEIQERLEKGEAIARVG